MKGISLVGVLLLGCSVPAFSNVTVITPIPAFSNVTVITPIAGAAVGSPFALSASATPCLSQPIAAMVYSLDDSTTTTIVYATSLSASGSASIGAHTLHVKSWGNQGASCVANVAITVVASPTAAVSGGAIAVFGIQKLNGWQPANDPDTSNGLSTARRK